MQDFNFIVVCCKGKNTVVVWLVVAKKKLALLYWVTRWWHFPGTDVTRCPSSTIAKCIRLSSKYTKGLVSSKSCISFEVKAFTFLNFESLSFQLSCHFVQNCFGLVEEYILIITLHAKVTKIKNTVKIAFVGKNSRVDEIRSVTAKKEKNKLARELQVT